MAVLNSACAAGLHSTRNSTVPRRGSACWCAPCVCADPGETNALAAVMPSSTESAPLMVAPLWLCASKREFEELREAIRHMARVLLENRTALAFMPLQVSTAGCRH